MGRVVWLSAVLASGLAFGGCAGSDDEPIPAAVAPADPLQRPSKVPRLAEGEACPRSPGGRPNPDIGVALGPGPAYPVLALKGKAPPSPGGIVPLRNEDLRGGIYWVKTLWAIDPRYDGPALIRAWRIDEPERVLFGIDDEARPELEFVAQESDSWRYGPSSTLLPTPGCYAFQVDGTSFSEVIVFQAER